MSNWPKNIQDFIDENSRLFVLAWGSLIGVMVRLVFDSKKKKITFFLFLSRYIVAIFVGWVISPWIHRSFKDELYGPIIGTIAVVSYEIVGIFITEVPDMFRNYLKRKFESHERKEDV